MKPISLQIAAVLVLVAFGIPITFFPIRWARFVGWKIPGDLSLARYFGRCLGALVLAMCGLAAWASLHPPLVPTMLAATSLTLFALSLIHVVGWLEKSQPLFETLEIGIYGAGGGYFLWLALQ